jgi:hypothetical protein
MHVGNIKTKSVLAWYNCNIYERMLKAPDVDVVQICVDESHDSGIMTTVYSSCLF